MATIGEDPINFWLKQGEVDKLEQVVLDGYGHHLDGRTSRLPKVNKFLKQVGDFQFKIEEIHRSVSAGQLRSVQQLIDRNKLALCRDQLGATPLHKAVIHSHIDIINYLLQRFGSAIHARDHRGRTALHYSAALSDGGKIYKLLVEAGADQQAIDMFGKKPEDYLQSQNEISAQVIREAAIVTKTHRSRKILQPNDPTAKYFASRSFMHQYSRRNIKDLIKQGHLGTLEEVVLQGYGDRLLGAEASSAPLVQDFLDNIPDYIDRIAELHKAVMKGNLREFQSLLDRPAMILSRDQIGATPLHKAVLYGHHDLVEHIANNFPATLDARDNDGKTALHYAAALDDHNIYNTLVKAGSSPLLPDFKGKTPDFYLRFPDQINLQQIMKRSQRLNANYFINTTNRIKSKSPYRRKERSLSPSHRISHNNNNIDGNYGNGSNNNKNNEVEAKTSADCAEETLSDRLDTSSNDGSNASSNQTTAIYRNRAGPLAKNVQMPVLYRLDDLGIEVSSANLRKWIQDNNLEMLEGAVLEGHGDRLTAKADILTDENIGTQFYITETVPKMMSKIRIIHAAVSCGDLIGLQDNLDKKDYILAKDHLGMAPLHKATIMGHIDVVQYILEKFPETVNAKDRDGRTALHYAAATTNRNGCKIYKMLMRAGADPRIRDSIGKTPEYYRVHRLSLPSELSRMNTKKKLNPINLSDSVNGKRRPILLPSVKEKIAAALHDGDAKQLMEIVLEGFGHSLFGRTFVWGEEARKFLKGLPNLMLSIKDLHRFIVNGDRDNVMKILNADPTLIRAKDENGLMPVHIATAYSQLEILDYFITNFPSTVYLKDNFGRTALHIAAQNRSIEMYRKLIQAGGDPKSMDQKGRTADYYLRCQVIPNYDPSSRAGEFKKLNGESQFVGEKLPNTINETIETKNETTKEKSEAKQLKEPVTTKLPSVVDDTTTNTTTSEPRSVEVSESGSLASADQSSKQTRLPSLYDDLNAGAETKANGFVEPNDNAAAADTKLDSMPPSITGQEEDATKILVIQKEENTKNDNESDSDAHKLTSEENENKESNEKVEKMDNPGENSFKDTQTEKKRFDEKQRPSDNDSEMDSKGEGNLNCESENPNTNSQQIESNLNGDNKLPERQEKVDQVENVVAKEHDDNYSANDAENAGDARENTKQQETTRTLTKMDTFSQNTDDEPKTTELLPKESIENIEVIDNGYSKQQSCSSSVAVLSSDDKSSEKQASKASLKSTDEVEKVNGEDQKQDNVIDRSDETRDLIGSENGLNVNQVDIKATVEVNEETNSQHPIDLSGQQKVEVADEKQFDSKEQLNETKDLPKSEKESTNREEDYQVKNEDSSKSRTEVEMDKQETDGSDRRKLEVGDAEVTKTNEDEKEKDTLPQEDADKTKTVEIMEEASVQKNMTEDECLKITNEEIGETSKKDAEDGNTDKGDGERGDDSSGERRQQEATDEETGEKKSAMKKDDLNEVDGDFQKNTATDVNKPEELRDKLDGSKMESREDDKSQNHLDQSETKNSSENSETTKQIDESVTNENITNKKNMEVTDDKKLINDQVEEDDEKSNQVKNSDDIATVDKLDNDAEKTSNQLDDAVGDKATNEDDDKQGSAKSSEKRSASKRQSDGNVSTQSIDDRLNELIDQWLVQGDVLRLEHVVIAGQGERLLGRRADNKQVQDFLNLVPAYMAKLRCVHETVIRGNLSEVKQILTRKRFALSRDHFGASPLHLAVLHTHTDVLNFIVDKFPETIDGPDNEGRTPLHYAAVHSDEQKLFYKMLLEADASSQIEDKNGKTPVYYLNHPGHLTIRSLLENYKRYDDQRRQSTKDKADVWQRPPTADIESRLTPTRGQSEESPDTSPTIKHSQEVNADVHVDGGSRRSSRTKSRSVSQASFKSEPDDNVIEKLSSEFKKSLEEEKIKLQNSFDRQMVYAEEFIDEQRKIDFPGNSSHEALVTIKNGENAAGFDLTQIKDQSGQTILHLVAAQPQSRSTFYKMLSQAEYLLCERDAQYRTPRDVAVVQAIKDNLQVIDKYILDAFINENLNFIKMLCHEGYENLLTIVDREGQDVIMLLKKYNVKSMINHVQDLSDFQKCRDELMQFIRHNYSEGVAHLAAHDPSLVTAKNNRGRCSLHIAVLFGNTDIIQSLINANPKSVDVPDNMGRTPLHYAMASSKVEEIGRLLIRSGANRMMRDVKMRTPSYYFVYKQDIRDIKLEEQNLTI